MRYRIKNIDNGEVKSMIFIESRPEFVKSNAMGLLGPAGRKCSMGNFVIEVEKGEDWVETDITISNPILGD